MAQWVYRPTESEHELFIRKIEKHSEYHSFSSFVREAVLRMLYDRDMRPMFTRVQELIDDLAEIKERYMNLLLELTDKPFER